MSFESMGWLLISSPGRLASTPCFSKAGLDTNMGQDASSKACAAQPCVSLQVSCPIVFFSFVSHKIFSYQLVSLAEQS